MCCSENIINKFGKLEETQMNVMELFNIIHKEIIGLLGLNLYEKIKNSGITDPLRLIFILCICLTESHKKPDNQFEIKKIITKIKENWDIFTHSLISN